MTQNLIRFSRGADLTVRRSWQALHRQRIDHRRSGPAFDRSRQETSLRGLHVVAGLRSDEDLLRAIAAGNSGALRALVVRHNAKVFRYALSITKDRSLAEEVVNDVFFAVARRAGSFEGRSRASTWLWAIARNKAIAAVQRLAPANDELAETVADAADDPEAAMQKRQAKQQLADCRRALPTIHREIIDLVYYHQKSIREIADILQIPAGTVKTRMFYARKALAAMFAADRDTATIGAAASDVRSQLVR